MRFSGLSIITYWILFIPVFYFLREIISIIFLDFFFGESFIFFFVFGVFFYTNFYYYEEKIYSEIDSELEYFDHLNFDLIYKFILSYEDNIWFLVNFLKTRVKKIFHFVFFFRNEVIINTCYIFYKNKIKNIFIIWRPIFKKWSYLGYYRSNRSKWIK